MYYCGYNAVDMSNGEGCRVSLFISGCTLHCKGCFSPSTWDFKYGKPFTEETKEKLFNDLSSPYIAGLSLLGGDPLEPVNLDEVTQLCKEVKTRFPKKTIWLWTGRMKNKIKDYEIMQYLDVVVSGPFVEKLKFNGEYTGSSNQEIWFAKTLDDFKKGNFASIHASKNYVERV